MQNYSSTNSATNYNNTTNQTVNSGITYTHTQQVTVSQAGFALFSTAIIFGVIFGAIAYLLVGVIYGKIFQKAGKKFSRGFIPFYNMWLMFEIAGLPGPLLFLYILALIPFVGYVVALVLSIYLAINLAKVFNKSTLFAVLGLVVFSLVGYIMLAFGSSTYNLGNLQGNHPNVPPTNPNTDQPPNTPVTSDASNQPTQSPPNNDNQPPTNIPPSSPIPPVS